MAGGSIDVDALVAEGGDDLMFGMPAMERLRLNLDCDKRVIRFPNGREIAYSRDAPHVGTCKPGPVHIEYDDVKPPPTEKSPQASEVMPVPQTARLEPEIRPEIKRIPLVSPPTLTVLLPREELTITAPDGLVDGQHVVVPPHKTPQRVSSVAD